MLEIELFDPEVSDYDGMDDELFGNIPTDMKDDISKLAKEFKELDPLVRHTEVGVTRDFLNLAGDMISQLREYREYLRSVNPFVLLDVYKAVDPKFFNAAPNGHPMYTYPNMALINDPNYCDYVDIFNLYHPENVYEHTNFFSDYHPEGIILQMRL